MHQYNISYKALFMAVILTFSNNAFAQNYYELINEATKLYHSKEYKLSVIKWSSAFKLQNGFSNDYYNAACTYSLIGDTKQAFKYLKKSIACGWEDVEWLKKDSDFANLRLTDEWGFFISEIPQIQENRLKKLKVDLKEKLEDLRMQDQTIRVLLPDVEKKFGRDSKEYKWYRNTLMPRNDSIVLNNILAIIDKEGWLGINEVGEMANQTLWLVIQHAPLEIQKKYLPLLKESVNKGNSKAMYLAFLEDRILMRLGKKQLYGTQSVWNSTIKMNEIYPVKNHKELNLRRRKVGLESIEEYVKNNSFSYTPEKW